MQPTVISLGNHCQTVGHQTEMELANKQWWPTWRMDPANGFCSLSNQLLFTPLSNDSTTSGVLGRILKFILPYLLQMIPHVRDNYNKHICRKWILQLHQGCLYPDLIFYALCTALSQNEAAFTQESQPWCSHTTQLADYFVTGKKVCQPSVL